MDEDPYGKYRVDGKCQFCQRVEGHAHDCPIFEHDLYSIAHGENVRQWHREQGESEGSARMETATIAEQISAIEAQFAREPEKVSEEVLDAKIERSRRYGSELNEEMLRCHELLQQVNELSPQDTLDAHPEMTVLREEYKELVARYMGLIGSYRKQDLDDPEYVGNLFGQWHMFRIDLQRFKNLLADVKKA